ncbi:MAG: hypothetical protein RDU25_05875 [Patescibacteria group bacterium]|nr:hypothetical protein [Patescibacteria group bacterium]
MPDDKPLIPKIDWTPSPVARIESDPPRPRHYGESTMSDEDYTKAQERARAGLAQPGILRDWSDPDAGEIPVPAQSSETTFVPHVLVLSEQEKRDGWTIERRGRSWAKVLRDEKLKSIMTKW